MACYSVLDVTPTDDAWVTGHLPIANARVAAHGGCYLARTASHGQVGGDEAPAALRIIIEWPSKQAALSFMDDEAYAPQLQARTDGSVSHHFPIESKDDLA